MDKKSLLGINITNATEKEILKYILYTLKKTSDNYYIVTPNPEILVYASKHDNFKTILNQARIALCDGVGVLLAGIFLGKVFKDRVTGVDLMENLCKEVAEKPITVGFLGSRSRVAEKTAECLVSKYPGLKVVFAASEWSIDSKKDDRRSKIEGSPDKSGLKVEDRSSIQPLASNLKNLSSTFHRQSSSIDILYVAFGFPKQEEWMMKNLDKGYYRVAIGVGGAFDYISGSVQRAPLLIRLIGFEWLFRLIIQPWRIKRQLALLEFIILVIQEKLGK